MKTLKNWKKEAKKNNLTLMGLTGSATGYPSPDEGWFAGGFDDFESAEKFAAEHGGTIIRAEWRDGWGYATHRGAAYQPLDTLEMLDENAIIIRECPRDYWKLFDYESEDEMRECYKYKFNVSDSELDEILREKKEKFQSQIHELEKINFKTHFIVIDDNDFEIFHLKTMNYSEDTHNYAIGVAWLFDEEY